MGQLRIGERVLVTRPQNTSEAPTWIYDMDEMDGVVTTITDDSGLYYMLDGSYHKYSGNWLTPISEDLSKWMTLDGKKLSIAKMSPRKLIEAIDYLKTHQDNWQASKIISLRKALAKLERDEV